MQNYEEFINNILETRGRFACGEEYHERHHIAPKCMGGTNDEENLIDLYAREHFEAHRLLALENPENDSIVFAWTCMAFAKNGFQERYELTSEEYEDAKIALSKRNTGKNNPMYGKHHSDETRKKIIANRPDTHGENNPMYGKTHSQDTKDKISNKLKDAYKYPENNPMYGKHHTDDLKNKISESLKGMFAGENNPMYGVHMSDESRKKMRQSKIGMYDGADNPRSRKVVRLSDLKIYGYLNEAAKENGMCKTTMRKYCKLHKNFMYYDEYIMIYQDI